MCCAAALWLGSTKIAAATQQNIANSQIAYQPAITPPARLQVSGAGDRLTLDVERGDVQSTLKTVLKQAGKQFVPDATVTGKVTLLLTDQPLETVLHSICSGCYLKYTQNPSGVFKFTRDDEAIKNAFGRLNQLNAQLRGQLRALGLDIPAEEQFGGNRTESRFAGGGRSPEAARDAAKPDSAAGRNSLIGPGGPAGLSGGAGQAGAAVASPLASNAPNNGLSRKAETAPGAIKKEALSGNANIHAYLVPQGEVSQFLGQAGRGAIAPATDFRALVQQNGFVWFNIPEEKPEPVASVLQLFSQQSNVPILVDQSIPNSLKFRVWGSLSPRQLPEALNVLAPTAHLQWRWIGNTIFVVPAPNFLVFFGNQGTFRGQYPAAPRTESNSQNDTKSKQGGSD